MEILSWPLTCMIFGSLSTMVHIHALYTEVATSDAVTRGTRGGPAGMARLVGGLVEIACRCCFGGPLLI